MKGKKPLLRRILAENLKEHRKVLGLSQEKLAEMAGLSWQTVNSIECHRTWVSDKTLENLADALKIESFQLLLPMEDTNKKAISSDEAVKRLEKIKRAFDDSFNEIVKLIEKKGKKKPGNSTANVKTQLSAP
jgi:transcriptional regulator with XRE-family HTH domain